MKDFMESIKQRRTYYGIEDKSPISAEQILEIIKECTNYVPSAFDMKSTRAVVLFGEHQKKVWDIAIDELKKIVPPDKFSPTEKKLTSYKNGYGTILFFDDTTIVESFGNKYSLYKENFPIWASQTNGMLQYSVWCALQNEGLGVSLQHYNPIIDEQVYKEWNIDRTWKHIAQMPFGAKTFEPDAKTFGNIDEMVKVFK